MIRHRIGRVATASSVVALLASVMLAGGELAANGLLVYFGSPTGTGGGYSPNGDLVFGTLTETDVTQGNKTAVVLNIENRDNQTLNHVKVAGGDAADAKPTNPTFSKPTTGDSLPSALSIAKLTILSGPAGTTCPTDTSVSFECNIGTLAPGQAASFLIVIQTPNTPASYNYWFTGSWNEGWSTTGNNADYNFATGTIDVLASSCAGGTSSWFLGNEKVNLTDGAVSCNNQDALIKSGKNGNVNLGGNGGFATVKIGGSQTGLCPAGFKCFGNTVDVSILGGLPVPGGVEWTVTWFGTKTIKGVIHYGDSYPTNPNDFTVITFNRQSQCSATKLTDCWVSPLVTTNKPASVTAVFVTAGNGRAGGWG